MDKCNFESGLCGVECKKYPMCAYMSLQKRIASLQEQINFMYITCKNIFEETEKSKTNIENLDKKVMTFTEDILDLINKDSETIKESVQNEKEN